MTLPYFYIEAYDPAAPELTLDEDNSRHIVQVLRMRPGESLQLTDGKGTLLTAILVDDHKKKCRVAIRSAVSQPPPEKKLTIAISPLKNVSRFEWFLEKAVEIGVSAVIPLLCERSERTSLRLDRLRQIAISAMLQSQQSRLTQVSDPIPLFGLMRTDAGQTRYIAHCLENPRPTESLAFLGRQAATALPTRQAAPALPTRQSTQAPEGSFSLILIGPEGDFSPNEVEMALAQGFIPVTLGPHRLRTETAGVVAAALLCIG
jgi:16S rRNA (uracil1498-N3)-methyltransferase